MIHCSYSLIAQLVEHSTVNRVVTGSSPVRGAILFGPVGQVVKTPPFHGGNRGSSPLRVIVFLSRGRGGTADTPS